MQSSKGEPSSGASRHMPAVSGSGNKTKDCYNVLFVCRDNSVHSIIAEAILSRWGGGKFRAYSAGIRPVTAVHPLAIDLLKKQRLWEQNFQTKGCQEFLKHDAQIMSFIISIAEQPFGDLPVDWPGDPRIIHWRISDPICDGSPAERALAFRKTFRELETASNSSFSSTSARK